MSQKLLTRLQTQFRFEGAPEALFYRARHALRFELGGEWDIESDQVTRFLQALDRARAICDVAFEDTAAVQAIISLWGRRPSIRSAPFKQLARMGFHAPVAPAGSYLSPDDDPLSRVHFFLSEPLAARDRTVLLWDRCACEIGIEPASPMISFQSRGQFSSLLVDFEQGLLVKVYDDRGMDVVATRRDTLRPLYDRFRPWLVEANRLQMDLVFRD